MLEHLGMVDLEQQLTQLLMIQDDEVMLREEQFNPSYL